MSTKTKKAKEWRLVESLPWKSHAVIVPYSLGSSAWDGGWTTADEVVSFLAAEHGREIRLAEPEFVGLAAGWRWEVTTPGLTHLAILWYPPADQMEAKDCGNMVYRSRVPAPALAGSA